MASFKLYLDTRTPRKDGTCPLKISINHIKSFLISLKVYTLPEYFIDNTVIIPHEKGRQENVNKYIYNRLLYIENTINRLMLLGELSNLSDAELKRMLDTDAPPIRDKSPLFGEHLIKFISQKDIIRTQKIYQSTYNKIDDKYNINKLLFTDINAEWLRAFDMLLAETNRINSRAIHMRNIRAIFNNAIDEGVIDQNTYPFRKFKIKTERTFKRSLTVDELRMFRDYPCEPQQELYRDIFMLIFYLIGINIIDLLHLKTVTNGRVEYRRAKTGRLYSIKVPDEAMIIINKYRGKDYLLDIMDRYINYRDFTSRINWNLKQIGEFKMVENAAKNPDHRKRNKKEITPLFPHLSTYWARHSWATIAASLDIPKETIAAALGHGGNTVTDIYIDFDQKKIDEANKKVITHL